MRRDKKKKRERERERIEQKNEKKKKKWRQEGYRELLNLEIIYMGTLFKETEHRFSIIYFIFSFFFRFCIKTTNKQKAKHTSEQYTLNFYLFVIYYL